MVYLHQRSQSSLFSPNVAISTNLAATLLQPGFGCEANTDRHPDPIGRKVLAWWFHASAFPVTSSRNPNFDQPKPLSWRLPARPSRATSLAIARYIRACPCKQMPNGTVTKHPVKDPHMTRGNFSPWAKSSSMAKEAPFGQPPSPFSRPARLPASTGQ